MAQPFNTHDYNMIIRFLSDNTTMPHKEAKVALEGLGVNCSSDYIYKLRRQGIVLFNAVDNTIKAKVERLKQEGNVITAKLLQERIPGIGRSSANHYAMQYRGRPLKVYKKREDKPGQKVDIKLKHGQSLVKTGIVTKDKNVTIHRMF